MPPCPAGHANPVHWGNPAVSSERDRAGLKTVSHVLVEEAGGVDASAAATRVSRTVLSDYGRPAAPHFMPADVILDLERVLGRPVVTQHLALLQGYDLVPIVPAEGGLVPEALAALGREISALFGEAAASLADNHLSDDETAQLRTRGAQARRALAQLLAALGG